MMRPPESPQLTQAYYDFLDERGLGEEFLAWYDEYHEYRLRLRLIYLLDSLVQTRVPPSVTHEELLAVLAREGITNPYEIETRLLSWKRKAALVEIRPGVYAWYGVALGNVMDKTGRYETHEEAAP